MDNIARKSLVSRKNSQHKTFALSVLSASLILANTAVYAADESPFSRAPLHLLNPGQTEIRTQTITHTEGVSDYKVTTPYTTTAPNVKPNIMLYLDNSNSMLNNQGKESVLAMVKDVLPQYANNARWGVTFMNGADTPYSWETSKHYNIPLNDNQAIVRDAINNAFSDEFYATPMIQGYITAAELLTKGMNNRCSKNYLIAMTDGKANGGPAGGHFYGYDYYTGYAKILANSHYQWYARYRSGFIPINAILNNTQYVKRVFPKYNKTDAAYKFLCPNTSRNNPEKGYGYCPANDGFVMYPYSGYGETYRQESGTAFSGSDYDGQGWDYILNNSRNGGYIRNFPNNSAGDRAKWWSAYYSYDSDFYYGYSYFGGTSSSYYPYILFTNTSVINDAPDSMRWLSKEWESKDLRRDLGGNQTITTFTIGFGSDFGDDQKG